MPVKNGVYTPLTLDTALNEIIAAAPSSIVFAPGNPPELILANMFAQASVDIDENSGEIMALFMSPVGAMIDLMNPSNPRKEAIAASGYVVVTNPTASPITIPANTILTAATGQQYQTGDTPLIVPAAAGGSGPVGTLDVPVTAIEILNEPNWYLNGTIAQKAATYAPILIGAYSYTKTNFPTVTVVGGSVSDPSAAATAFLTALYAVNPAVFTSFDVFSSHP